MAQPFSRERLAQAFRMLGEDLSCRGVFVEIAVYGGSALMMQFAWERSTEDVDAVVREGHGEDVLAPSVVSVAERLGLERDWLNDAVGMFTPPQEDDDLFSVAGSYPGDGRAGLRVLVATPAYLLALKLHALSSRDRGDKDVEDARRLALHLGLERESELLDLYASVYADSLPGAARERLVAVLAPR